MELVEEIKGVHRDLAGSGRQVDLSDLRACFLDLDRETLDGALIELIRRDGQASLEREAIGHRFTPARQRDAIMIGGEWRSYLVIER